MADVTLHAAAKTYPNGHVAITFLHGESRYAELKRTIRIRL